MTRPELRAAMDYCDSKALRKVIFVVPFPISVDEANSLRAFPRFSGMILQNPDPALTINSHCSWLGCVAAGGESWQRPTNKGHYLFIGPSSQLKRKMLAQIAQSGNFSVICLDRAEGFSKLPLWRLPLWRLGRSVVQRLSNESTDSAIHRTVRLARRVPGAQAIWHRFFRRESPGPTTVRTSTGANSEMRLALRDFQALVSLAAVEGARNPVQPIRGRILLVNSGLAAGGAERQIVNTLAGLKRHGYDDVCLLGEYLDRAPGLDFYLPQANALGIQATQVLPHASTAGSDGAAMSQDLRCLLDKMPVSMTEEILNLVGEFRQRCPETVHAWQDSTSIKAGIAALIVGVPNIVLSSRNVTPVNFAYYQPYMRDAYKALAEQQRLVLLNNSEAGADDYCQWLDLPRSRYQVIRNGLDLQDLSKANAADVASYRDTLGIPQHALVVGSIFRFWAEKRPLLWLESCVAIAEALPEAHFLLIGEGPMRNEMERFVKRKGLSARVHMPGARTEIALPLSAMQAFLLTSEFEGTPNVLLEAQWMGLPVVAADAGGSREALQESVTGYCIDDASAAALASKIVSILQDADYLRRASSAGPAFVAERFGMERMIAETLAAYGAIQPPPQAATTVAPPCASRTRDASVTSGEADPAFCAYPWQQMIIDLTGEVVPCCFWSGYGNTGKPLGNTNQNSLEEIWNGEGYQSLRRANASGDLTDHPCNKCMSYRWSNGRYPRFSSPSTLNHENGHCYLLSELPKAFATATEERFEGWSLYEDEQALPLPAAKHDDIRQAGSGRYSLWGRVIYLSSTDNSDPRSNGRRYSLRKGDAVLEIPAGAVRDSVSGRNLEQAHEEYRQGRTAMAAKPSMISLISTADCNIDCPGCSQNTVRITRVQHRPETVPDVLQHVPYLHQFIWHGGEPYLIKRFRQFIDTFEKSHNPNLSFGFTSNGTMLTEKELQKLGNFPRINASISVDSFKRETFENIRAGASFNRVMQNLHGALARQDRPYFTISCGMIVCKSNFLELPANLAYAMEHGIGLNLSPVLIYPVSEQLNLFEDFERETQGWEQALDEAFTIAATARREERDAIRHVDPEGMLLDLRDHLAQAREKYASPQRLKVSVRDPHRSIRHMRRPGIIVFDTTAGNVVGYVRLTPDAAECTLQLPGNVDVRATYWRVVHDLFEPMGAVVEVRFPDARIADPVSVVIPRFLPVARPLNHFYANYGETSPEGLHVIDTQQITESYHQILAAERLAATSRAD